MTAARKKTYAIAPEGRLGLSRVQAAEYIGVSPSLFDQMVARGHMPPPRRYGSRTIWDRRQVDEAFSEIPQSEIDRMSGRAIVGKDPHLDLIV